MYCMYCGAENSDTAKFCRGCGKPLQEAPAAPPAEGSEDTIPLAREEVCGGEPSFAKADDSTGSGGEPSYGNQQYNGNSGASYGQQTYGGQPYGNQQFYENPQSYGNYGNQQSYGNPQSYGNQQTYGGQPYGNQQSYENPQAYGNYGNQQPYGNSQSYGNQPSYGNSQSYGNQSSYGSYGYQQPYGAAGGKGQKKKGKKGVVIGVIVALLAVLLGGGAFLYIKSSDPMAPVDDFFNGMKKGNWNKVYDSIYWGEEGSTGWMSKDEFIRDAKDSMGGLSSMSGVLDSLKVEKVSEESYDSNEEGLPRKKVTVEMSVEFMGMSDSQEMEIVVVKSGKKFLFIPVWKIDNEEMDNLF